MLQLDIFLLLHGHNCCEFIFVMLCFKGAVYKGGCRWSVGYDGFGLTEIPIGVLGSAGCAEECWKRSRTFKQINGATVRRGDGYCWCEIEMKMMQGSPIYNTCYIKGRAINQ